MLHIVLPIVSVRYSSGSHLHKLSKLSTSLELEAGGNGTGQECRLDRQGIYHSKSCKLRTISISGFVCCVTAIYKARYFSTDHKKGPFIAAKFSSFTNFTAAGHPAFMKSMSSNSNISPPKRRDAAL